MGFFSSLIDFVIPFNEVKEVISDAIPNEVKSVVDPLGISTIGRYDAAQEAAAKAATGVAPAGGTPQYDDTLLKAFNAQLAIEPKLLEANKLYQPQWLELQKQIQSTAAKNQMDLMGQLYPQAGTIEAAYQNQLRQAELQQIRNALPQYQQAFNALTPGYAQALQSAGQLAQQSMQNALMRPQLTAFESGVAGPTAGSYLSAVQNFVPTNVAAGAGMPQEAGYLNAVPSPGLAAMAAGQVPGGVRMAGTTPASTAAASAGAVPAATAMQNAMRIEAAQRMAGAVPTAQGMRQAQTAQAALEKAGAVPTAENIATAQSAQSALRQAGAVPTARNLAATQSAAAAAQTAGTVPATANLQRVAGPRLASNIQQLDRRAVEQYIGSMPGMANYANMLARQSQDELAAGRSLTAEEQRMADQSARAAYAARGTALGPQAVNAEILNRADVANQRYQQRLQNATQAAGTIQAIYQPALQQSLQRQQLGIDYGLGLQQQQFGQAQARDVLNQQTQAQRYAQAMGTQGAGFEQAAARDQMAAQLQAQRFNQLSGTQQAGFQQAATKDQALAALQAQRFGQLSATQQAGFGQAQAQDAAAQSLQAQRYAQAMGFQTTGFEQAQARDTMAAQLQAQRYAQAMGTQGAGFQQAQAQDVFGRDTQQQQYAQLMGTQGAAFQQAGARESLAQQLQQSRYNQLMGQQQLFQGAQAQQFQQAMGREQLGTELQQAAFNQALQRGQAEQQRLQVGTALQAGQAQLGAGAMGQLQSAQAPILQAYYRQPILQQTVGQAQTMGLANQQASGNTLFQPESQLAFQSAFLPYQSQIALQQAQMQSDASKAAGKSAMTGSIIGAAGAAAAVAICWVAREVYGTQTGTWKIFRAWVLNKAPEWFKNAYIKHGQKIAEFIKDKPVLKSFIRRWMDSKIESYLTA